MITPLRSRRGQTGPAPPSRSRHQRRPAHHLDANAYLNLYADGWRY
ncbi:MAG: hypothetical protein ACE5MB_07255 [Anaerolineae bacterium]